MIEKSLVMPPHELSKEAADKFEQALLNDTAPPITDAIGLTDRGYILDLGPFECNHPYQGKTKNPVEEIKVVELAPWKGPLKRRLNCQASDVRKRLQDSDAVILVLRGVNYSAKSVLGVIWLFLKTRYLRRLKKLAK